MNNRDWQKENLDRHIEDTLKAQKKLEKRLEKLREVLFMRVKNKATLEEIGQKYGCSKQNISALLKQFNLLNLKH